MPDEADIQALLKADEARLQRQWRSVEDWVEERFGREPSLEAILFLIGIQTRGRGFEPELGKTAKEALVAEGTYGALEALGLYARAGIEADGSWIWEKSESYPESLSTEEEEKLLRAAIVRYFNDLIDDPTA